MSPQEAARIDRIEFQHASDDALERAIRYAREKRQAERAKFLAMIVRDTGWTDTKMGNAAPVRVVKTVDDAPTTRFIAPPAPKPKLDHIGRYKTYTYQGRTMTCTQWAAEMNLNFTALYGRLKKGMSIEDALAMAVEGREKRRSGHQQSN